MPTTRSPNCPTPRLTARSSHPDDVVHVCDWSFGSATLEIGSAQNGPFSAQEKVTYWRAWPNDKKERRELKHRLMGWKLSHDHTKLTSPPASYLVVRDSAGRVLRSTWSGQDYSQDVAYYQKLLCDPETETETDFNGADSVPIHPLADGQLLDKPNIRSLPWHSHVFNAVRWGSGNDRRKLVDLGYRQIEGIRAHGRRWLFSRDGSFTDGDFKELWVSEDLKIDILFVEQNLTAGKGTRAELTQVRLAEPDPKLFQMGEGIPAVVRHTDQSPPEPCSTSSP